MNRYLLAVLLFVPPTAPAQEPKAPAKIDYTRDVQPILAQQCFLCHGPDKSGRKADLRLDVREGALADLGGHAAIVPGKPDQSELVKRLTTADRDEQMPPAKTGKKLTPVQVDVLRRWIAEGAPYAKHWAFVKPERAALPAAKGVVHPVDRFVSSRLAAEGLAFRPEADRHVLGRRVAIDLTGLPLTLEEADAFAKDTAPGAYEKLVDRLLASPAYGERWAKTWLDLARYADSQGYAEDRPRTIWSYRDWVIQAFNDNLPYDRFTVEQLAGDLLPGAGEPQLRATAFHRNTLVNTEGGTDDEEFRNVAVVDRVNTTMQVWMGLTVACAQCHDHKYDPFSQEEFFRLFAFFNSTEDNDQGDDRPTLPLFTEEQKRKRLELEAGLAAATVALARITPELDAARRAWEAAIAKPIAWKEFAAEPVDGALKAPSAAFAAIRVEHADKLSISTVPAASAAPKARLVRVELTGAGRYLHLAEVQVFSGGQNVAPKGKAAQSSVDFDGPAGLANDGNTNGDYNAKSVCHTAAEDNPWWEVDLGADLPVEKVVLWNRTDGGDAIQVRMKDYRLKLLDAARKPIEERKKADYPKPTEEFVFDGVRELVLRPAPADGGAVFVLEKPVAADPALGLRIRGAKGKLWIAQDAAHVDVPAELKAVARKAEKDRSKDESEKLAAHHRLVAPELAKDRELAASLKKQLADLKPAATVPVMKDLAKKRTTKVHLRGNWQALGKEVAEGVPAVFPPLPAGAAADRLALARWIVHPDNPLTARVAVNRFWEQLFGAGLVLSSEDWGVRGARPSHPELLDGLAVEFVESGWDVKKLLRLLVTSAAYRQSSAVTPDLLAKDPTNRWISRGPRVRLAAEFVRDQVLFVSGLLSRKVGGPSVYPPQPKMGLSAAFSTSTDWETSKGEDRWRRGLYTFWRRSVTYPSMATFDAPDRQVCTVRRIPTNTPLQALVTMNDPVYVEAAQALARRIVAEGGASTASRAAHGVRLCLQRPPTDAETKRIAALFDEVRARYAGDAAKAKEMATNPIGPAPAGADVADLAAWTVVGNVLLNLDEMVLKR